MTVVDLDRFTRAIAGQETSLRGFVFHMRKLMAAGWVPPEMELDTTHAAEAEYPPVYTVAEAAGIMRVKPGTVYRAIYDDKFEVAKVGRFYRIHEHALDRYLKPWLKTDVNQNQRASGCAKTMNGGSSSIEESKSQPELAVELANQMLKKR